jgi:hypothetical protein
MPGHDAVVPESSGGRRVYIHRYAFRCLITQTPDMGKEVCDVLAQVRAAKLIHHHLIDTGGMLGLVRPAVAEEFARSFPWKATLSSFLCSLAYRPCFPRDRGSALPVLRQDESVVASCTEAGYYTFATGETASDRMFADHAPMADLQRSLTAGHGPADLTLIKGRSLVRIDLQVGVGHVGHRYSAALAAGLADTGQADEIDATCRTSFLQRVQQVADSMLPRITNDERRVLDELMASLHRSFQLVNSV